MFQAPCVVSKRLLHVPSTVRNEVNGSNVLQKAGGGTEMQLASVLPGLNDPKWNLCNRNSQCDL